MKKKSGNSTLLHSKPRTESIVMRINYHFIKYPDVSWKSTYYHGCDLITKVSPSKIEDWSKKPVFEDDMK